jgi:hypothetical protein
MVAMVARHHGGPHRRPIQAVVLIGVLAAGIVSGVGLVHAYDPRLDEALAALQKAAALVEASSPGEVSARTQHKFDNERNKALASIQDAMEHIVAAGLAADADGGSQ